MRPVVAWDEDLVSLVATSCFSDRVHSFLDCDRPGCDVHAVLQKDVSNVFLDGR